MTIEEAKKQLRELILDRELILVKKNLIVGDSVKEIYRKDIEALKKALELFEKQMPRKVIRSIYYVRFCPTCQGYVWQNRDESKYCFRCGQALDWGVDELSKPKAKPKDKRMFTDEQIDRILWEIEQINKEQREEEND